PLRARDGLVLTVRYSIRCDAPLGGRRVAVTGLVATGTTVLAEVDGDFHLLTADRPALLVAVAQEGAALRYLGLGVEHVALGIDHRLFVLGLCWLGGTHLGRLTATVTSCTRAHSLTLAAAATGAVRV